MPDTPASAALRAEMAILRDFDDHRFMALDRQLADTISRQADIASEMDRRYQQRFDAQQQALQDALMAQEKAVNAALAAADRAVLKAEVASEKRFDSVNEFRATLADQAASLMPRGEAEARLGNLGDKVIDLATSFRDRADVVRAQHSADITALRDEIQKGLASVLSFQDRTVGRDHGYSNVWAVAVGVCGVAALIIDIITRMGP